MERATAVAGMSAALAAAQISPYLDRSRRAMGGAEGPLLEVVGAAAAAGEVVLPLLLFAAVLAAVAFLYVYVHNGGRGGGGAGNRRIPEVVSFVLSVSIGLLVVCLVPNPGAIAGGAQALAPSLGVVAFHAVLPSAVLALHLSVALVDAIVRAGGGAAGNGPIQPDVAVELLAKLTLGATIVSFIAIFLAFYAIVAI